MQYSTCRMQYSRYRRNNVCHVMVVALCAPCGAAGTYRCGGRRLVCLMLRPGKCRGYMYVGNGNMISCDIVSSDDIINSHDAGSLTSSKLPFIYDMLHFL